MQEQKTNQNRKVGKEEGTEKWVGKRGGIEKIAQRGRKEGKKDKREGKKERVNNGWEKIVSREMERNIYIKEEKKIQGRLEIW